MFYRSSPKSKFLAAELGNFEAQLAKLWLSVAQLPAFSRLNMITMMNAATPIMHYLFGLYPLLWTSTRTTLDGLYKALHCVSRAYPPANHFLTALDGSIRKMKTTSSEPAELSAKIQDILQEFWTPQTLLEGLVCSACYFSCVAYPGLDFGTEISHVCCLL